ncbi:MAG: hypothetical protein ACYC1L_06960 [Alphaproteobacteria bacterium]
MPKTWATLEKQVRDIAALIYDRPAAPEKIGGVDIDCVVKRSADQYVLIEITEMRDLNKVREDVNKLETARGTLFSSKHIQSSCYVVVGAETITTSMVEAGKERNITVTTIRGFTRRLFDFQSYKIARERKQFGSAVNPVTGEIDQSAYTPVSYLIEKNEVSVDELADLLIKGKTLVMTGEYGSGKSRCGKELFTRLAEKADSSGCFPIAIDLRENWGLRLTLPLRFNPG